MAPDSQQHSGTDRWTIRGWRKPKEPEARNIVLDVAEPDFISDSTKRRIAAFVLAVLIIAAVVLGVVLSQGGNSNSTPDPIAEGNETTGPTRGPSASPSTAEPTSFPTTAEPTAAAITDRFLNGLPRYSLELASGNASSPQAKALLWMQSDPLYNKYQNVYRLNQRYALAVLYHATNGDLWFNNSGWLSNDNECKWYTDGNGICSGTFRLLTLYLDSLNLNGSIPTESYRRCTCGITRCQG
jgi:hypothetical protein